MSSRRLGAPGSPLRASWDISASRHEVAVLRRENCRPGIAVRVLSILRSRRVRLGRTDTAAACAREAGRAGHAGAQLNQEVAEDVRKVFEESVTKAAKQAV